MTLVDHPDLGSGSDWLKQISNQSEAPSIISIEFLRSFLRRHFTRKLLRDGVAKCRLFSQAVLVGASLSFLIAVCIPNLENSSLTF